MPKDGQGSSSPYIAVEFEYQRQRTQPKHRTSIPHGMSNSCSMCLTLMTYPTTPLMLESTMSAALMGTAPGVEIFLGRSGIPPAGMPALGEQVVPQIFPLEKTSLSSPIHGEITLKIYRIVANGHLALAMKDSDGKKKMNGVNPSNNNQSSPTIIVPPLSPFLICFQAKSATIICMDD